MLGFSETKSSLGIRGKYRKLRNIDIDKLNMEDANYKLREYSLFNLITAYNICCSNIVEDDIRLYELPSYLIQDKKGKFGDWDYLADTEILRWFSNINSLKNFTELRLVISLGNSYSLTSPRRDVLESTIREIDKLNNILNLVGGEELIITIGQEAGDKKEIKKRFISNFNRLSSDVRSKVVLKNDKYLFGVEDILSISRETSIPVVLDYKANIESINSKVDKLNYNSILKTWNRKPLVILDYNNDNDFANICEITNNNSDILVYGKESELNIKRFT